METVMRLVMCNWTWSHFAQQYSASTYFTWKSTLIAQRLRLLWAESTGLGTLLSCCSQMSSAVVPFSYVPKKTTIYPHTAFSQVAPPSMWLVCPLELSLYEKDKNTACCEFMAPSELPLKTQPFSDVCSETQVRKQSNHNIYTEWPQHRSI